MEGQATAWAVPGRAPSCTTPEHLHMTLPQAHQPSLGSSRTADSAFSSPRPLTGQGLRLPQPCRAQTQDMHGPRQPCLLKPKPPALHRVLLGEGLSPASS